jgi:hypothetical protein
MRQLMVTFSCGGTIHTHLLCCDMLYLLLCLPGTDCSCAARTKASLQVWNKVYTGVVGLLSYFKGPGGMSKCAAAVRVHTVQRLHMDTQLCACF